MITTQNGSYEGDTPFFNRPWLWGQDGIQTYRDPNTGSTMLNVPTDPVVRFDEGPGGGSSSPTGQGETGGGQRPRDFTYVR